MSNPLYPCPSCGKETKVMHDPVTRICSLCRKVSYAKDCVPSAAPLRKDPSLDTVAVQEGILVGLDPTVVPPLHPCPSCKKETKDAGGNWRVCRCGGQYCQGCGSEDLKDCTCTCGCDPKDPDGYNHIWKCPELIR